MAQGIALRLPPSISSTFGRQNRKPRRLLSLSYVPSHDSIRRTPQLPDNRHQHRPDDGVIEETQVRIEVSIAARSEWLGRINQDVESLQRHNESLQKLCEESRAQRAREEQLERERLLEQLEARIRQRHEEAEENFRIEWNRIEVEKQQREQEIQRQAGEARRRWAEEQERIRLEEETLRLQEEEAERQRQLRLRECSVCLESGDISIMVELPCNHWYCREDLEGGFRTALDGTPSQPFQCCGQDIPIELHPNGTPDFLRRYAAMQLERSTPNPAYCANRLCGLFIPPANYSGPDLANCDQCGYTTCRMCRNPAHGNGQCPQDEGLRQVERLATQEGWMRCVNCGMIVEKVVGCNHMTCRCGSEWCYVCRSRSWRDCGH